MGLQTNGLRPFGKLTVNCHAARKTACEHGDDDECSTKVGIINTNFHTHQPGYPKAIPAVYRENVSYYCYSTIRSFA